MSQIFPVQALREQRLVHCGMPQGPWRDGALRVHSFETHPLIFEERSTNMRQTILIAALCAGFACSAVSNAGTSKNDSDTMMNNIAWLTLGAAVVNSWPDIRGNWKDNTYSTNLSVGMSSNVWYANGTGTGYSFSYAMRAYDNSLNRLYYECVAQTGSGCTVGKFGAVAWTEPANNSFYWCEYAFNLTSVSAAQSASASSAVTTNLSSGCNGFAWNKYDKQ